MNKRRYDRRSVLKGAGAAAMAGGLGVLSVSCSGDDDDEGSASPTGESGGLVVASPTVAQDTIKKAAVQKLTVRQYNEPVGLDPHTLFRIEAENIATNVFAALTAYDPQTGDPIPDLATKWEISPDAKKYTFHLVQNANWHQGMGPFTSADVKYSYDRVMDPKLGSIYAPELNNVASVEATDKYTVVFNLKAPDANFLYQVGNYHQGQIVKKEAVEKYGDKIARNPVGLGPFEMTEWQANSYMVLKRHAGYHKPPATLEEIRFNLITDVNAAEAAIINGEVAVAMSIGSVPERIKRLQEKKLELPQVNGHANNIWMFNPTVGKLSDPRLRKAIAYGMDIKNSLAKFNPLAAQPYSLLPKYMKVYSDQVTKYEYDPKKAKALMAEAGLTTFAFKLLTTAAQGSVSEDTLFQQALLKEVGINMELDIVENTVYNSRRTSGDFEVAGRLYPAVNPDTLLFGYLHPDNLPPKGFNGARYNNPEVTGLLESARAELDETKRKDLYAKVQKIVSDDLPYLPFSSGPTVWASYPWVKNIQVDRLSCVNWYPVVVEEHA
jgi:peptide/nickel transport system substrate-binding protein